VPGNCGPFRARAVLGGRALLALAFTAWDFETGSRDGSRQR
jgi:hypothetical protein